MSVPKHSAYCHGEDRKLESFLSPSGGWAGAQCHTVDQKHSICSLTSLRPYPVKEAKVTEQRGHPICHPSPATKPRANTLVLHLSSLMVWHQCLLSHHSLHTVGGGFVRAAEWGGDVLARKSISAGAGSTFFDFVSLPWTLDFYTQLEEQPGKDRKAVTTPLSGNHWFSKHLPLSSPLTSILQHHSTNKECFDCLDDSTGICLFKSTFSIYIT